MKRLHESYAELHPNITKKIIDRTRNQNLTTKKIELLKDVDDVVVEHAKDNVEEIELPFREDESTDESTHEITLNIKEHIRELLEQNVEQKVGLNVVKQANAFGSIEVLSSILHTQNVYKLTVSFNKSSYKIYEVTGLAPNTVASGSDQKPINSYSGIILRREL